ncbi:MAG: alpha/beta-hydrolase family protein [Pseudonocardiales bacterium]|nr:alpha/beta-hydrolase family protein [Pseudonocardiales bacterium]
MVDQDRNVRFVDSGGDLGVSPDTWQTPRMLYMQNGSDPVTWWSLDPLFSQPDWLDGDRPPDVSPQMRWYPVVTFCQVTLDLVAQSDPPARRQSGRPPPEGRSGRSTGRGFGCPAARFARPAAAPLPARPCSHQPDRPTTATQRATPHPDRPQRP